MCVCVRERERERKREGAIPETRKDGGAADVIQILWEAWYVADDGDEANEEAEGQPALCSL